MSVNDIRIVTERKPETWLVTATPGYVLKFKNVSFSLFYKLKNLYIYCVIVMFILRHNSEGILLKKSLSMFVTVPNYLLLLKT